MKKILLCLAAFSAVAAAQAHFVYAVIADNTMKVGLEEWPGDSDVPNIAGKGEKLQFFGVGRKALKGKLSDDGFLRADLNGAKVAGAEIRYGVLDKGATFLLDYHAKAAVDGESAKQIVGLGVELVLNKDAEGWYVQVMKDKKPVNEVELTLELPGVGRQTAGNTGKKGLFRLEVNEPGRVIIRGLVKTPVEGEFEGKKYPEHRAYSTLVVNQVAP